MSNVLVKAIEKQPAWQDNFKSCAIRVGFGLVLTRAMCEFLSAVADGVAWDRSKYGAAQPYPDNFLATSAALFKRGLIAPKPENVQAERGKRMPSDDRLWEWSNFDLTPAGVHVVGLLKLAGLFVEADAAIEKKARGK